MPDQPLGGVVVDNALLAAHARDIARHVLAQPVSLVLLVVVPLLWLWLGVAMASVSWTPFLVILAGVIVLDATWVLMVRRMAFRAVKPQYPIGSRIVASVHDSVLATATALSRGEASLRLYTRFDVIGRTVVLRRVGGGSRVYLPQDAFDEAGLAALAAELA